MKILLLAGGRNHVIKWLNGLVKLGHTVYVVSLIERDATIYTEYPNVQYFDFGFKSEQISSKLGGLNKLVYLKTVFAVRRIIREVSPDLVHCHYASSYGLIGALTGFKPLFISVWGSDIYDFPRISWLHKLVIQYTLKKADLVFSTSNCMAKVVKEYTKTPVEVISFGVDTNFFIPDLSKKEDYKTVVGTVKGLNPKYGIDNLIRAFNILVDKHPKLNLELKIIGDGREEYKKDLISLAESFGISNKVLFRGYVNNADIPAMLNSFDIYVALSNLDSESFGVAIIEAMSCGIPVVVSDVDGFMEVVLNGKTGIIIPRNDVDAAAKAIEKILLDNDLQNQFSLNARNHVLKHYRFDENLNDLISQYKRFVN